MVSADYAKPETLLPAFQGAYGAYLVTNYWEHMDPERERAQIKELAIATKAANLQHVVWFAGHALPPAAPGPRASAHAAGHARA